MEVEGSVARGFEAVRRAFAVAQANDVDGAQLAVHLRGRPFVDLWSAGDESTQR